MAAPVALADRSVVAADAVRVRSLLDDVAAVIGCIPGASVKGEPEAGVYAASIGVQYAETGVRFDGTVRVTESAEDRLTVRAEGRDGVGTVRAEGVIRLTLGADGAAGTAVDIAAEFTFSGVLAPLARSATRIVGPQLLRSFARCLAARAGGSG
jgi:carbon monoxide dehydrogenase subunit G